MCTDFVLPALLPGNPAGVNPTGASVVSGRTLDWHEKMAARLLQIPKDHEFDSLPSGKRTALSPIAGMSVGPDGDALYADVLNADGLSVAGLWCPQSKYPWEGDVGITHFAAFIAANCADVPAANQLLQDTVFYDNPEGFWSGTHTHCIVHDRDGRTLIVEWDEDRSMHVYTNGWDAKPPAKPIDNNVLTNFPKIEEQLSNLSQFNTLTNNNRSKSDGAPQEVNGSGMDWEQATRLHPNTDWKSPGLPADATPESRFVRITTLKKYAADILKQTGEEKISVEQVRVLQALHLLNNMDVVYGSVRAHNWPKKVHQKNIDHGDFTLWSVVRDHGIPDRSAKYYYRTALNMNLRCVDLSKIDSFSAHSIFDQQEDNATWRLMV